VIWLQRVRACKAPGKESALQRPQKQWTHARSAGDPPARPR
jgi:hypothetical protein